MSPRISNEVRDQLLTSAREAMAHAYAPYSKFQVGAAILTSDGKVFTGCNVENASYGLTICAERNAIFAAVAAGGSQLLIQAVAVTNSQNVACSPCGACRQVIAEFGKNAAIFYQGPDGIKELSMRELLPDCFSL
jgi:cytidine deaminase